MATSRANRWHWATAALAALVFAAGSPGAAGEPAAAPAGAALPGDAAPARSTAGSGESCIACHQRRETMRAFPAHAQDHFLLWFVGAHGRAGVGCHECHGGDPAAQQAAEAHAKVLASSDPRSPVYFKNLPKTCGTCHPEEFQGFVHSAHYKQLVHDHLAPSCSTCHGALMETDVASPALAERCLPCHNAEDGVMPEVAQRTRQALERVSRVRAVVAKSRLTLELVRERGIALPKAEERLAKAEELLGRTPTRWHRFRLQGFEQEILAIESMARSAQTAAMEALLEP